MENPQFNPVNPVPPQLPAEKSQAGTNLAIVVLVLIIVAVGVKLLMPGSQDKSAGALENATSTEQIVENTGEESGIPASSNPESNVQSPTSSFQGKGQATFRVFSAGGVIVRQIFVHNPFKTDASAWVKVYDGYKAISAGSAIEVFTASLAAITYDMVRVMYINTAMGVADESTQSVPVTVTAGAKTAVTISL